MPTTVSTGEKDDALLATTRWTARLIVPVLAAAFAILYVVPDRTEQLWAWTIRPDMTSVVMGGGYLSGAYFFVRVARSREWHRVAVGFLGTTIFTTVLLAATVLHWDRFNHDHVSFWAWLALYIVTPALLPMLWVVNQRRDPGVLTGGDVSVPRPLRTVMAIAGIVQLGFAAALFARPSVFADRWPWPLTPLTARTIAAFIAFPAVTWVCFLVEHRWSALRFAQQTALLGLVLVGLGAVLHRPDLQGPDWSVSAFAVALVAAIGWLAGLQLVMDNRVRRAGAAVSAAPLGPPGTPPCPGRPDRPGRSRHRGGPRRQRSSSARRTERR